MKISVRLISSLYKINSWVEAHSAWAAWLQAFGAIVALALTLGLAYQTSNQVERQSARAVKAWSKALINAVDEQIAFCQQHVIDERTNRPPNIKSQDLMMLGQSIVADRLPEEKIDSYLDLRMLSIDFLAARVDLTQAIMQRENKPIDWKQWELQFQDQAKRMRLAFATFESA